MIIVYTRHPALRKNTLVDASGGAMSRACQLVVASCLNHKAARHHTQRDGMCVSVSSFFSYKAAWIRSLCPVLPALPSPKHQPEFLLLNAIADYSSPSKSILNGDQFSTLNLNSLMDFPRHKKIQQAVYKRIKMF